MAYNTSKQYIKLPKSARGILDVFDNDGNRTNLFKSITDNVATQKTVGSKHTRLSIFRGMLRKYFGLIDDDMKSIDRTTEEKNAYFALGKASLAKQHEDIIDLKLLKSIIDIDPLCYLMVTSGRRIGEILDNRIEFKDGQMYAELNKTTNEGVMSPIHILGSVEKWKDLYDEVKSKKQSSIVIINEINAVLKVIIPNTFYKRSSHICRSIYIRYIHRFQNTGRNTLPQVISRYLHHDNPNASIHYQHVILGDDVTPIFEPPPKYDTMGVAELKALAKKRNLTGYSKLKKADLIQLLA